MTLSDKNDLSLDQAIDALTQEVAEMRENPNQQELTDISSDDAFILGYETSIHDLKRITRPSEVESGIITYFAKEKEETDDH